MKLKITYSPVKPPLVAVGINQCRMLEFAFEYPGWHSCSNDRATVAAARGLKERGAIEINEFNQFRANIN